MINKLKIKIMKKETLLASMPKMVLIITMVVMLGSLFGAVSYLLKMSKTDLPVVNPVVETQCKIDNDCILVYVGQGCSPCDTASEKWQCLPLKEAMKINEEYQRRINDVNVNNPLQCAMCVERSQHTCKCANGKCEKVKIEEDETADWQTYQSEKGGFELSAPAKWGFYERISSVANGVDLFLFFDEEVANSINDYDYAQLNIRIKQNKLNLSMEDFYNGDKNADLFSDARSDYDEIAVGGKSAIRFKEKDDIGTDVVVIPLQDKFVEIDSANSDIEIFNKILLTFEFIEKDEIADWKVYRNEEFGFEFEYPEIGMNGNEIKVFEKENVIELCTEDDMGREYNWCFVLKVSRKLEEETVEDAIKRVGIKDKDQSVYFVKEDQLRHFDDWNFETYEIVDQLGRNGPAGEPCGYYGFDRFATDPKNPQIFFLLPVIQDSFLNVEKWFKSFKFINQQEALCTDDSVGTAIGSDVYPIDSKYKSIHFLGQLFTAANCGEERLSKIWGVDGEDYTLGSAIWLIDNPSSSLVDTLKSIGYQCADKISDDSCKEWELEEIVKINDLLKLEPYYKNFKQDDCRRGCG